jgi:7,8-dihydropterin-6-yl-methyl-4-(beta-D-ribofuranosyl)aminobenzene 5'-phosphate synthase
MKATIVFDNTTTRADLTPDWGFACFVETNDQRILFDTGANGDILLENMYKLKIDPTSIDEIFISHDHFDHVGGLPAFLDINNRVKIYIPPSLKGMQNAGGVVCFERPTQISDGLYSTGELEGIEQAMAVKTKEGLIIFTGCSHPKMKNILKATSQFGDVYGIIGGLHGFDQLDLFKDFRLICATHCTRKISEIKSRFPQQYIEGGVGRIIEVN